MDTNHGYDNDAKSAHRDEVRIMHGNAVGHVAVKKRPSDATCVTLVSMYDTIRGERVGHPSRDIVQWSPYFGRFIGVNSDTSTQRAFRRYHSGHLFIAGDGYEQFANLAQFHSGLYYLDTTQTLMSAGSKHADMINRFLANGKLGTTLALNLVYNSQGGKDRVPKTHNASPEDIAREVRKLLSNLNADGWKVHYSTYKSTKMTRMVTVYFTKPTLFVKKLGWLVTPPGVTSV